MRARITISAVCRMYVDLPPMFGPVMTSMRRASCELQIVRHERLVDELLDDRMAAVA